jgi:hypothetical protein
LENWSFYAHLGEILKHQVAMQTMSWLSKPQRHVKGAIHE